MADGDDQADPGRPDRRRGAVARGSGQFGAAKVTHTHCSEGLEGIRIVTRGGREIVSTPEHTHFAGYRLGMTPPMHVTYLMRRRGMGCRVGTTRTHARGSKSVVGVQQRAPTERADAIWVIGTHESDAFARAHEAKLAARYQLPMVPFVAARGASNERAAGQPGPHRRHLREPGHRDGAHRLLHDEGLWPEDPHHMWQGFDGRRRNVVVTLCADKSGAEVLHTVSVGGRDESAKAALERLGLRAFRARRDAIGWRADKYCRSYSEAAHLVRDYRERI